MGDWCPRCAAGYGYDAVTGACAGCWDGRAGADDVRRLAARTGSWSAEQVLGRIADPAAVPALRELASDASPKLRAAAIRSLGPSGGPEDVALVAAALRDAAPEVRERARIALAHLGGADAADALAGDLGVEDEYERRQVVAAMAWLEDERAVPAASRLASGGGSSPASYSPVWALMRLAGEPLRRELRAEAVERLAARTASEVTGAAQLRALYDLLARDYPAEAEALLDEVAAAPGLHGDAILEWLRPSAPGVPPRGPRTVARLAFAGWRETPPDGDRRAAKIGGQPEWVAEPAWPLDPDGRPMVFYGQFPVGGDPARLAYLFVSLAEGAENWEPLGAWNELVVQPGPPPRLPAERRTTGPGLYELVPGLPAFHPGIMRPLERWIELEPGAEPERWDLPDGAPGRRLAADHRDWNKLGGAPLYLQGEERPPGEGWRFAFQFNAARAGYELADGAECYGFVRDDGAGAFLWQSH